jgi:DNA invertase Pin-like site-specific DNA recombinase
MRQNAKGQTIMTKRAVIYVRTSTEHQGEKASPGEQEADCRKLAAEQGLTVVHVYRDIERYRIKNKWIEPSGTRHDRPGLLAMLNDAAQNNFDIILAWREDRLYRGMRAMLMVIETIQEHKITIMLARETFDSKMAPVKAWVAQMELEGIKERMTMGVKARLRAGKANAGRDRYGYQRNGEVIEIVEEEAKWVQAIFAWYIERIPLLEIRRRLIESNVPQKGGTVPRRILWSKNVIQQLLGAAKEYTFGLKTQSRGGETFTIPVPPILDIDTYNAFLRVKELNTNYPARHIKQNYLIGGLLYCSCNRKWGARCETARRRNRDGEWIPRKGQIARYFCRQIHEEQISPDCPRQIGSKKADKDVWAKVCQAINQPEILLAQARKMVNELQANSETLEYEKERIRRELDTLTLERQWVITQARRGGISENDMDYQLGTLELQEISLKRDFASIEQSINIHLLDGWEERVEEYLADLQVGIESLNADPQSPEDEQEIFELKRQIITTLVSRVTIDRNRELHVEIRLNLLKILNHGTPQGSEGTNSGQIKTAGVHPGWRDVSRPTSTLLYI